MRVGIYARVSTHSTEQQNALEQQIDRLQKKAADLGDSDPASYVDIASGSRDDRPELSRLMADCARGLIGTVVVTRLDRLSRSSSHGAQLLKYFAEDDTPNLVALDDSLDLATPGGKFMARLLISWAEAETDRLSERTRHGHAYRRQQRKAFGWKAPFGYVLDGEGGLAADPDNFEIAEEALERFLNGQSLGSLVTWFLEEKGHKWGNNWALRRWLCNPTLVGARAYGQRKTITDPETGAKRTVSRPPGEYGEIYWLDDDGQPFQPPLLTREQHAFVLGVFHERSDPSTRPLEGRRTRPLTGIVSCMDCGRTMEHHRAGKGGALSLRCKTPGCVSRWKTIREADTRLLLAYLLTHQAEGIARHWEQIRAAQAGKISTEQAELREQIQKLEEVQASMDDQALQTLLNQKHEDLAALVRRDSSDETGTFLKDVARIQSESFGKALITDYKGLRKLFQLYLRAGASKGKIRAVEWAKGIAIPGQNLIWELETDVDLRKEVLCRINELIAARGLTNGDAENYKNRILKIYELS